MTATADDATDDKKKAPRDPAREVVETVVFVVVLVLLLKLFITEAFVIPTGSMAETLYGYQKIIKCPKCAHSFPLNSHSEVEGEENAAGRKAPVRLTAYVCPNCRHNGEIEVLDRDSQRNNSGDRVLVLKPLYHLRAPARGDVVVFKFPETPQTLHTAQNYIKRAMGFGGETMAVYRGDLYVTNSLTYDTPEADPKDWWQPRYRYRNHPKAVSLFEASRDTGFTATVPGGFQIVRKGEDQLLADRRLVWDNDRQPDDLAGIAPSRWYAVEGPGKWNADNAKKPTAFAYTGNELGWVRYRHSVTQWKTPGGRALDPLDAEAVGKQAPALIDNFLGYNASRMTSADEQLWVGDLILECEARVAGGSEVALELSRGPDRFRATFGGGKVTLSRSGGKNGEVASRPCKVTEGTYKLRFANVDARLWVWVDGKRIDFGTEADYEPTQTKDFEPDDTKLEGWVRKNDIDAPAGIGAKGSVTVQRITLHRDIYYTWGGERHMKDPEPQLSPPPAVGKHTAADIYYVQPGHYFCLGDNSAHSADSRAWGVVPDRLMLGKAVFVFFPVSLDWKFGWPPVRGTPDRNRVGFIK